MLLLQQETPAFISPMHPVTAEFAGFESCKLLGGVQKDVLHAGDQSYRTLTGTASRIGRKLDHSIVVAATGQWRHRLSACVRACDRFMV